MKERGDLTPYLRQELQLMFAGKGLRLHDGSDLVASFDPIHPSWKPIEIIDDWDEATVHLGEFTHLHFGNYDTDLPDEARMAQIATDVCQFLTKLFEDQIEVWCGRFSGGCRPRGTQSAWSRRIFGCKSILWSGRPADCQIIDTPTFRLHITFHFDEHGNGRHHCFEFPKGGRRALPVAIPGVSGVHSIIIWHDGPAKFEAGDECEADCALVSLDHFKEFLPHGTTVRLWDGGFFADGTVLPIPDEAAIPRT